MNRYHVGFTLAAGVAIFLLYLDGKPPTRAATEKWPTPAAAAASSGQILPSIPVDSPFTSLANPVSAPVPATADNRIEGLLTQMETLLQELATLQNLLANTATPEQMPDPILAQAYQPRIEELTEQLNQLVAQASSLSRPRTERFIWQQVLSQGLNSAGGMQVLGMVLPITDPGVFADMLTTLANGSYPVADRTSLAYSILLPNDAQVDPANAGTPASAKPLTARQQRILGFLDEQFMQEADPELLNTYLDIYFALAGEQYRLIPMTRFWEQLETLRSRLAPDRYFSFRLQKFKLTDADNDYADIFQDIANTPLSAEQRRNLLSTLSNTVFMALSPNAADASSSQTIPEQQRQLLLRHLENHLATPALHDRYGLYEYSSQVYAIELLKNREQAAEAIYQRIMHSQRLEEQAALLLGIPMNEGDTVTRKLRQDTQLQQRFSNLLQQPNLAPDIRSTLQDVLSLLQGEPPQVEQPVDEYGNPVYSTESFSPENPPAPGIAPDSAMPAQ